jgi:type I restriction enzyme S subunit
MPQDLYNLPAGWEWKALDSITQVIGGGTPKTANKDFWGGDIVWLSPTDLPPIGEIIHIADSAKKITKDGLKGSSARLLPKGAVVYSTRATIGKIAIADCDLATNQGFTNFVCSDGLYNRYLTYALVHFNSDIAALSNSTTFKEVSKTNVKAFQIPLPPLPEQERIVEKLDALFRRIDAATARLNQILTHSQALFASALADILGVGKWPMSALESKVKIQSGTGFPEKHQGASDEEFPFLKVSDMNLPGNEKRILSWNNSISEETAKLIKAKIMPEGTIIFPKIGAAIATNKKRMLSVPSAYDNNVMGLVPSEEVLPEYLFWYMQSMDLSDWASASALPSMKASTVKEHKLPLPPLEEQRRIVEHLEGLSERIQTLKKTTRDRIAHLAALKASLLAAAFRGNL